MARVRFILHLLTVAMLAFGLASVPLYAVAQAADAPAVAQPHHKDTQIGKGSSDHDHAAPAKPHAMGQSCCHPGCVMAVVPGFASLVTAPMQWAALAIPGDRGAVPIPPQGLDRPPKLA